MRDQTVAKNYAEALFELATRHEGLIAYSEGISLVANVLEDEPSFRRFLETPRVSGANKKAVIRTVFGPSLPPALVTFLLITVDKRRQRLLGEIAREFHQLVDEHEGRVNIEVSVAREIDEQTKVAISERMGRLLGKEAVAKVRVRPELLGGVMVRAGDTIYDGSIRSRLSKLKQRLLTTDLPA